MRKLILCLLFSFSLLTASSQDYKEDLKRQFLRYTEHLSKKEFPQAVEYINPDMFTILPKAQLINVMEQAFNNKEVAFDFQPPSFLAINDKQTIKGIDYVKFEYTNIMEMKYKSGEIAPKDSTMMLGLLQGQFGEENVSYNTQKDSYAVKVFKKVIANSKDTKNWKFLVIEERQKPLLEKIIPKELL
ncbi:hypothetical protein KJS94_06085 [Flavihumibacter rivuli]|uniref:hypothetical protein n=1 Tax=Flavihumibacter rivuli TaxID=2838156 RepID=UPI001BDE663A|nr:hypothetical protein [Flavihumibacter rivuli]ULQ57765.1 hypothetical protein KJS94_06085 [Flavihumibacter rivuli]